MNKLTKRLLSVLVVAVMAVAMLPVFASADPVYTDWNGDAAALVDGAYLKLSADKTVTEAYTLSGDMSITIDLNGKKITSSAATQIFNINNATKLTLKNGTIEGPGAAEGDGALLYVGSTNTSTSLTMEGVTVTKTAGTSNITNGGVLYARRNVTLTDCTIQMVPCETHVCASGGLMYLSTGCTLTVNNSTLTGGVANTGGNIFATGSSKVVVGEGSVITGGEAIGEEKKGHAVYTGNANVDITINGGTVGQIYLNRGDLIVNSGTLTQMYKLGTKDRTVTIANGVVTYFNPALSGIEGFEAYLMDKTDPEQTKYTVYTKLDAALTAAKSGDTVSLMSDVTADEVLVPAGVTLNLYGKTLTANVVNAAFAGAQIKDEKSSKNAGGKLICNDVSYNEDNVAAPIYYEGAYHFQKFVVAEKQEGETFKFYISDATADILLDEVWANGYANTGLELHVVMTWKENGVPASKTVKVPSDLIEQYVADWDNKMFIMTIVGDMTNVTELACTARVAVA